MSCVFVLITSVILIKFSTISIKSSLCLILMIKFYCDLSVSFIIDLIDIIQLLSKIIVISLKDNSMKNLTTRIVTMVQIVHLYNSLRVDISLSRGERRHINHPSWARKQHTSNKA